MPRRFDSDNLPRGTATPDGQTADAQATDFRKDEKSGLYLPEGARKGTQPIGFAPPERDRA